MPETAQRPRPANPGIPGELVEVASLSSWIEDGDGDLQISHVHAAGDGSVGQDFELLELSGSRIEGCSYVGCDFARSAFSDVAFSSCDFSNSSFSEANFTRCTFADRKSVV